MVNIRINPFLFNFLLALISGILFFNLSKRSTIGIDTRRELSSPYAKFKPLYREFRKDERFGDPSKKDTNSVGYG